jgi:hypothetical protein
MKLDRCAIWACRKDMTEGGIKHFLGDELIDRSSLLKAGVDGNQRLWPEALFGVSGINLRADF